MFRFGHWVLDTRSGELRRNGIRVRLQRQPLEILCVLLERQGQLVERAELHAQLWAEDTFVDFDHGLNAAVRRLRAVLGDRSARPRFIETQPRAGYRFIAPVECLDPSPATVSADTLPARMSETSMFAARAMAFRFFTARPQFQKK